MVLQNNEMLKPGISRARQLAESDDIASNLSVDSMLGFTTHKMAARFRPLKVEQFVVSKALAKFAKNGDAERAYNEIVFNAGEWARSYFLNKSKAQIATFKEHVSIQNGTFHSFMVRSY